MKGVICMCDNNKNNKFNDKNGKNDKGDEDMSLVKNSVDLKASFKEALIEVQENKEGKRKSRSWREMMSDIEKDVNS